MTIEVFKQLGKPPVAKTVTDSAGRFSFPKLRPGKYFLKGTRQLNDKYVIRADDTIVVTRACFKNPDRHESHGLQWLKPIISRASGGTTEVVP